MRSGKSDHSDIIDRETSVWYWINREKSRYYKADLVKDLFGEWALITAWGALDTRQGQVRSRVVSSYEEGLEKIAEIDKRRRQHGYRGVVTTENAL